MKPRNIGFVINRMLEEIPADNAALRADLGRLRRSASFTAPEMMCERWVELADLFNGHVFGTSDTTQWVRERAPAWADRAGCILGGPREPTGST